MGRLFLRRISAVDDTAAKERKEETFNHARHGGHGKGVPRNASDEFRTVRLGHRPFLVRVFRGEKNSVPAKAALRKMDFHLEQLAHTSEFSLELVDSIPDLAPVAVAGFLLKRSAQGRKPKRAQIA
jgi:hypothetical protein